MLNNYQNYYMFADLVRTGKFYLRTSDITSSNWQEYYDGILNILKDNIETEEIKCSRFDYFRFVFQYHYVVFGC